MSSRETLEEVIHQNQKAGIVTVMDADAYIGEPEAFGIFWTAAAAATDFRQVRVPEAEVWDLISVSLDAGSGSVTKSFNLQPATLRNASSLVVQAAGATHEAFTSGVPLHKATSAVQEVWNAQVPTPAGPGSLLHFGFAGLAGAGAETLAIRVLYRRRKLLA